MWQADRQADRQTERLTNLQYSFFLQILQLFFLRVLLNVFLETAHQLLGLLSLLRLLLGGRKEGGREGGREEGGEGGREAGDVQVRVAGAAVPEECPPPHAAV